MRRLIRSCLIWISTVCKCMSEFTWCPKLPDFTLVACQKGIDKQQRPRSDCFPRSSLIWVFPACYWDNHFVDSSPDSQLFIREQNEKSVRKFRTIIIVIYKKEKRRDKYSQSQSLYLVFEMFHSRGLYFFFTICQSFCFVVCVGVYQPNH